MCFHILQLVDVLHTRKYERRAIVIGKQKEIKLERKEKNSKHRKLIKRRTDLIEAI